MRRNTIPMPIPSVRASVLELWEVIHRSQQSVHTVLPHIASLPDPVTCEGNPTLARIVDKVKEQCCSSATNGVPSALAESAVVTDHWLLSVPETLRSNARDVVNYLGMLVAIDFRHWAEEDKEDETGAGHHTQQPNVLGFYTVVQATTEEAERRALHPEAPSSTATAGEEHGNDRKKEPVMLRGSAAMMYLLRRAVDEHQVPWYDPVYYERFQGNVQAAQEALQVCFLGCREDGVTPLWMPATEERVSLLLSLSKALQVGHTCFYDLLCESNGRLFGASGFVQKLVDLHERYHDWAPHPLYPDRVIPILKLSQLTALALENALPALWAWKKQTQGLTGRGAPGPEWLQACAASAAAEASSGARAALDKTATVFADARDLSICCDYQIPKALREAGLLVYDEQLAHLVDNGIVLEVASPEEVSLRVGALCAVELLLQYLNRTLSAELWGREVAIPHLDYVLWYVGRYPSNTSLAPSRHHLCRTIMY